MRIHSLIGEDIPEIANIEQREQITPIPARALYAYLAEGMFGWTAWDDGCMVGYTLAQSIDKDTVHSIITCIAKGYQSQGTGQELCKYAIDKAKEQGYKRATFEVRVSNIAEQKMVAHFGATVEGKLPMYYGNEDGLIMQIDLEKLG